MSRNCYCKASFKKAWQDDATYIDVRIEESVYILVLLLKFIHWSTPDEKLQ